VKLSEVERQYDRASKYYDAFSSIVLGGLLRAERYRERAVDLLGDIEGATVLDVGCGTARNFDLLVPRVGKDGQVVGLDLSRGMLDVARRRVAKRKWGNVELLSGDACSLERVAAPVDALISVWCYGLVDELDCALSRAIDVVRPGGRISIMVFVRSRAERGPLRYLHPIYEYAMQRSGIDRAGDTSDAKLVEKWGRGRALLRSRLEEYQEETYLFGTGAIFAGRKT
jgi:demethylmenaquinone methyltransferase/2-methoxy-6-polyprenyl-1,4-benzoquinol methylase